MQSSSPFRIENCNLFRNFCSNIYQQLLVFAIVCFNEDRNLFKINTSLFRKSLKRVKYPKIAAVIFQFVHRNTARAMHNQLVAKIDFWKYLTKS